MIYQMMGRAKMRSAGDGMGVGHAESVGEWRIALLDCRIWYITNGDR
jgi:hypothetical protein